MRNPFPYLKEKFLTIIIFLRYRLSRPCKIDHECYLKFLPLISTTNSFLQSSLGMFIPAIIALNGAFLFLAIEQNKIKSIIFYISVFIFIPSTLLYISSIVLIFLCANKISNALRNKNSNIEEILFYVEEKILFYNIFIYVSSILMFLSFILQLYYVAKR